MFAFFFAFLRLDDACLGAENRTILANFQQKSMSTTYPQDRWLPTWSPPYIKAVSLHFASEPAFLCLFLAVDLLLCCFAASFCLLLSFGPCLLLSIYISYCFPAFPLFFLSFSSLLILFASTCHSLPYLPRFLSWSYFWHSSLPPCLLLILVHNILKEHLITLA